MHTPVPARKLLAGTLVALALVAAPGVAVAQDAPAPGGSAFSPLGPSGPVVPEPEPEQVQVPQQPQPQPVAPRVEDQMLSTPELILLFGLEVLLLAGLAVAIAREGGPLRRITRRARHARRAQPPPRTRGATHLRAGAKAPPPPPRRRRAKAARRAKAGRR